MAYDFKSYIQIPDAIIKNDAGEIVREIIELEKYELTIPPVFGKDSDGNQTLEAPEKKYWGWLFPRDKYWTIEDTIKALDELKTTLLSNLQWKQSVETFDDLTLTYPNPQEGWTVSVNDTNTIYRYDAETQTWIGIGGNFSGDLATSERDGLMSKEDKIRLDGIFAGNLPLVDVVLQNIAWTIYYADGTEATGANNTNKIDVEVGYKVKFSGQYKWTATAGKKNPTVVDPSSNWNVLTASGILSPVFTSAIVSNNSTFRIKLGAAKTGLMVSGTNVVPAAGNDYKEAIASVTFKYKLYYGVLPTNNPSETEIKNIGGELVTTPNKTVNNVTALNTEYYIFAYPAALGNLTKIIQDGATPVLGAFTLKTININTSAKITQVYNLYISNNPGAFTNASLQFIK